MKTKKNLSLCCAAVALLAFSPLASRASETTAEAKDQTSDQTHVLFTGTDIQVQYQGALYRARDVVGDSFIIKVKDKVVEIPMGANPEKLKVAPVQTLTERFATVTNYKHDRVYTAANDPYRKWSKGMMNTQALQEQASIAEANLTRTPKIIPEKDVSGRETGNFIANPMRADVEAAHARTQVAAGGNMGRTEFYASEMAAELAQELFDAVDVQFEVASTKPIRSPYVVVVAKFHEKDDPQHPQNWLFAKAIDPIDSTPQKVSVREGGFPPGFVVEKLRVHIYEHGVEVATNFSENRAPLTREEAHEYLVINHVSTHKTDTIPARVALTKAPEDWATRPKDESVRKTYYVKVDKEGRPVGSFEDEACKAEVADSYYEGVLRGLLFLPALEKGKAVEGVARVKLTELSM